MKNKLKYLPAILLTTFLILSITVGVGVHVSLHGTPWQKYFCRKAAEEYLLVHFPNTDFQIDAVIYDFKGDDYVAKISSPSSVDSEFHIDYDPRSKETRDSYESEVTSGWNTLMRLDEEYHQTCKAVFNDMNFPYVSDIAGGDLMDMEDAIPPLDQPFDLQTMGKNYGSVTFYAQDEVTMDKACEILLAIRKAYDEAGVPFKVIDFVLQPPKDEWQNYPDHDWPRIHVEDFPYEDIYTDGLMERVQTAHDELTAYYAEQDKQKQEEMASYEKLH